MSGIKSGREEGVLGLRNIKEGVSSGGGSSTPIASNVETVPLGAAYSQIDTGTAIPHFTAINISNPGSFNKVGLNIRDHSVDGSVYVAVYDFQFNNLLQATFWVTSNGVRYQNFNSDATLDLNAGLYYVGVLKRTGTFSFACILGDGTKTDIAFQGTSGSDFTSPETTFNNSGRSLWAALSNQV